MKLTYYQPSLFDEPTDNFEHQKLTAIETPDLDDLYQMIEPLGDDGKGRVRDHRLASWMGYSDVVKLRTFTNRNRHELEQLGSLSQSEINPGRNGGRPGIAYAYDRDQINYILEHCGLKHLDGFRVLVITVFGRWQDGRLAATDADVTIELQDAAVGAEEQAPGSVSLGTAFFAFCEEVMESGKAARAAKLAAEKTARTVAEIANNQRRYPLEDTIRTSAWVIKYNYLDYCPCCQRVKVRPNGAGTHWAHMKGKYRREVLDGWFVCAKCNHDYEDSKNTQEIYIAFIAYVRHVEAYLAQGSFF